MNGCCEENSKRFSTHSKNKDYLLVSMVPWKLSFEMFFTLRKKKIILRTVHWKLLREPRMVILWCDCENPLLESLFLRVCCFWNNATVKRYCHCSTIVSKRSLKCSRYKGNSWKQAETTSLNEDCEAWWCYHPYGAISWKWWETRACLRQKTTILKFWHRQTFWMNHCWGSEEFRSAFAFFKSSICCELKKLTLNNGLIPSAWAVL